MADVSSLLQRIDDEFTSVEAKVKQLQSETVKVYEGRQQRLELFQKACEKLREVWKPRLEALSAKFGQRVKVTPRVSRQLREATFEFDSKLARIILRFNASTDEDVRKLVLDYQLEILPILMKFEPHARAEFPLEGADPKAVEKWIDDRIVDFVRTYLSLHQNEYYLKGHLVVDPIAGVEFPKYAAAATLDWQGKPWYFISEKTRGEFAKQHGITCQQSP